MRMQIPYGQIVQTAESADSLLRAVLTAQGNAEASASGETLVETR